MGSHLDERCSTDFSFAIQPAFWKYCTGIENPNKAVISSQESSRSYARLEPR
jgi:hypothetical protein